MAICIVVQYTLRLARNNVSHDILHNRKVLLTLSIIRAFVFGSLQSTLCFANNSLNHLFVSSVCSWSPGGNLVPSFSSNVVIMSYLFQGRLNSSSNFFAPSCPLFPSG